MEPPLFSIQVLLFANLQVWFFICERTELGNLELGSGQEVQKSCPFQLFGAQNTECGSPPKHGWTRNSSTGRQVYAVSLVDVCYLERLEKQLGSKYKILLCHYLVFESSRLGADF